MIIEQPKRRRGSVRRALEYKIGLCEFGLKPRNRRSFGGFIDAQARQRQHIGDRHAAFAHRARQRLAKKTIGAGFIDADRPRRGVIRHEAARFGLDQREARRQRAAGRIGRGSSGVEHDDARLARRRRQRMGEVGEPHRFERHIGVARDLRINRREEILALIL